MAIVSFLSDFGLKDEYVSVCKGVIKKIAPSTEIIDISHQVPKFDVTKGALMLAAAVSHIPAKVHLAVVDPGVGSKGRGIIIQSKKGNFLVGPNNGLLIEASKKLRGIEEVVLIENEKYMLDPVSSTFHARDMFAPVVAYLTKGTRVEEFGRKAESDMLIQPFLSEPSVEKGKVTAEIIDVDDFGTVRLNCKENHLKKAGVSLGEKIVIEYQDKRFELPYRESFASVDEGLALILIDSVGHLSIAVNQGSAKDLFGFDAGEAVIIWAQGKGKPEKLLAHFYTRVLPGGVANVLGPNYIIDNFGQTP